MSMRTRVAFDGAQRLVQTNGQPYTPLIANYNVTEDSTPVDPADTSGGVGQFTISFPSRDARAERGLRRKIVDLEEAGRGVTQGIARVPSSSGGLTSVTVDSKLTLLAVERTAAPYVGTLGGYITYLLGLVGITDGYQVDDDLAAEPATFIGWYGDVWVHMKALLAGRRAEISLVSDKIIVRKLRERTAVNFRDSAADWSVDDSSLALSVQGYVYDSRWVNNGLAYPSGGWNEDVTVFQVDAGEQLEPIEVPIDASLISVIQPQAVDYVTDTETSASVYCVMGADGLPVSADMWEAYGGKIVVEIGEDSRTLIIKITGATLDKYAPYRIAATSGPSNPYSSLRILGTGVYFERQLYTFPTGVSKDYASQEVGAVVDSEFITSLGELYDAIAWTHARYTAPRQTITVTTGGINRQGEDGSYAYPEIVTVNANFHGDTVGEVDAVYAGKTLGEVNEIWQSTVAADFANQAFGNVAGARVLRDEAYWRIRSVPTFGPSALSYTAEYDTLVGDVDAAWVTATIAEHNAEWAGRRVGDLLTAPLAGADDFLDGRVIPWPNTFSPDTDTYPI